MSQLDHFYTTLIKNSRNYSFIWFILQSTLHVGASFLIEQNDNSETLGRQIFFIFTPYNYKKSSENVKPKMKKFVQARGSQSNAMAIQLAAESIKFNRSIGFRLIEFFRLPCDCNRLAIRLHSTGYLIASDCYSIIFDLWKSCIRHFSFFFCCCYLLAWIKNK